MSRNMLTSLVARVRSRTRSRAQEPTDNESGSLILDILIGMAIFALIAIIAVSAVGQYRMRAYEQSAASDTTAVALALEAAFTDEGYYPDNIVQDFPTGAMSFQYYTPNNGPLRVVETPVTISKNNWSVVYFTNDEGFITCVEHYRGGKAWAMYDSLAGGLVGSGRGQDCLGPEADALLQASPVMAS